MYSQKQSGIGVKGNVLLNLRSELCPFHFVMFILMNVSSPSVIADK
jgi:hypothetical protein